MADLPDDVVDEAERLTRHARAATDPAAAEAYRDRRDSVLSTHGFAARVREADGGATLVCYPAEWVDDDGVLRTERVDDTDDAVEVSLEGPGDPERWAEVADHNRELAAAVREAHGDVHGENAEALADFMNNHYAKEIERATRDELAEFLDDYFPRNAWPSDAQRDAVEQSLEVVFDVADAEPPVGGFPTRR